MAILIIIILYDKMSKNIFLQNSSYRMDVNVDEEWIYIVIHDFSADFGPYQNGHPVEEYFEEVDPTLLIQYNIRDQQLIFRFKKLTADTYDTVNSSYGFTTSLLARIESRLNIMRFHEQQISAHIEQPILQIPELRLVSLTHSQAVIALKVDASEIQMKTETINQMGKKSIRMIDFSATLLTTRLFDSYVFSQRQYDLQNIMQSFVRTTQFQHILDEVFETYSLLSDTHYVRGRYRTCNFVAIANSFDSIRISFKETYLLNIKVIDTTTIEISDMRQYGIERIQWVRNLAQCLHHCVSNCLKDPSLSGHRNNIDTSGNSRNHKLQLHKPEHVHNTLMFLLTFIHTQHLLGLSKNNVRAILVPWNPEAKIEEEKEGLVQKIKLSNTKTAIYFNLRLDTQIPSPHQICLKLTVTPGPNHPPSHEQRLNEIKGSLEKFFEKKVKKYSLINPTYFVGFMTMMFVQVAYQKRLTEILDFELSTGLIELLFTTFTMTQHQFSFDVRMWTNQTYKDCRFTF